MYPWEAIEAENDSTLRLIHEAVSRGNMVAVTTPNNLTIRDSVAYAFCQVFKKGKISTKIPSFYRNAVFNKAQLPLAGFDVIVMRANPPLDSIALNFLDSVRTNTLIINDIDGLRIANNKLYTASLHDPKNEFIPITHVSKSRDYLVRVLEETEKDKMIMKPLNSYGGRGVILVEKRAKSSFKSLLDFYIGDKTNYVILQECVDGAEEGDVRILMLNGEPIGAMRRVPAEGDVRSNIHAGGKEVKHSLSKAEKRLCKYIGPKLVRDGLFFVGIDVINGKLIEVNVLSPGGITRINRLNRTKLQCKVIDFIENIVDTKEIVNTRKNQLRQVIENADL